MTPHRCFRRALALTLLPLLGGCSYTLFDPKGPIADAEMWLIITSALVMLIVVVPVIVMSLWFPWKYRASKEDAPYEPDWEHSNRIEAVVWGVPIAIIIVLGVLTFITSFSLDPRRS